MKVGIPQHHFSVEIKNKIIASDGHSSRLKNLVQDIHYQHFFLHNLKHALKKTLDSEICRYVSILRKMETPRI